MASAPDRTRGRALEARISARLAELNNGGLLRTLRPPQGIDLSSNDYLGLAKDARVVARMQQAIAQEGCGATASRLLRGERASFAGLERDFARFKNSPAALFFGSGYAANIGVLSTFLEADDLVFTDSLNHASIIDGIRLSRARKVIFPHCDVNALAKLIAAEPCRGTRFLVTESIFSMDGDEAPLAEYAKLCRATDTALIVDEAHAVGIYGARGSGLVEARAIEQELFIAINPCGKALGACGAFVTGQEYAIEYLIQRARTFIFSTAPPPAVAGALTAALEIIDTEPARRQQLLDLAAFLREKLSEIDVPLLPGSSQIIPVMLGENERAISVAAKLQAAGFDVRAIRPPTVPVNSARLRLSVNVDLSEKDLRRFIAALADILR